jgi:NAD+ synthase
MRQQLVASGSRGFILGLSGGVDSAVALRLSQLAAPGATVAAVLPCHSDPKDEEDASMVAARFSAATVRIDLSGAYDNFLATLQPALQAAPRPARPASSGGAPSDRLPLASIKPRLRMATLYFLGESLNYLVVGTSNRSGLAIGAFTKHGDNGADLLPLGRLAKGEVRAMAGELGVPASILSRPASSGLWIGQTDEEEMGFRYEELERYLDEGPQAVPPALAMKIERLIRSSDHKRELPPMPDIE